MSIKEKRLHQTLFLLSMVVFVWSYVGHYDTFAWSMLSLPIVLMLAYAVITYPRFQFTSIAYIMLLIYVIVLWIGAKYTYNMNPWFDIIQETFDHSRNHYDRVGHFFMGFVPIFFIKEYLLRKNHFKRSFFFYLVMFLMILGIAATWELLEFLATIISDRPADYMLAAQGDIWDTHWDILYAPIGAAVYFVTLSRLHDRQMEKKMSLDKKKRDGGHGLT